MTTIKEGFVIAALRCNEFANYIDVNLSNIVDPMIWPVNWFATPTLDAKCACFNYFFAKLSNEMSCNVMKKMHVNSSIAIL